MLTAVHRVSVHINVPVGLLLYPVRISSYQWATPRDTQCHKHYGIDFPLLLNKTIFILYIFIFCYIQGIDTICINKHKSILDICGLVVCGTLKGGWEP